VLVRVGEPCDCADTDAFDHQRNNLCGSFQTNVVGSKGLRWSNTESGVAGFTAVSLDFTSAVASESLDVGVLAFEAGHGALLDFSRRKRHNAFGIWMRPNSAFEFGPAPGWRRERGYLLMPSAYDGDLIVGTDNLPSVSFRLMSNHIRRFAIAANL